MKRNKTVTYNTFETDYRKAQKDRLQEELDEIKAGQIIAAYTLVIVCGLILGALFFWVLSS